MCLELLHPFYTFSTSITSQLDPLGDIPSQNLPLSRPWTDVSASTVLNTSDDIKNDDHEGTRLLALPSPAEVLGPEEDSWRNWLTWNMWMPFLTGIFFRSNKHRRSKKKGPMERGRKKTNGFSLRLVRSSLLVMKVLTISQVCVDPVTRPRPVVVTLLLVAAVSDTVIEHEDEAGERREVTGYRIRGVWVTMGLALLHVGILGLSAWSEWGGAGSGLFDAWKTICCVPVSSTLRGPPPQF